VAAIKSKQALLQTYEKIASHAGIDNPRQFAAQFGLLIGCVFDGCEGRISEDLEPWLAAKAKAEGGRDVGWNKR